ncbi:MULTISPECIES: TetR family transcriptional regulator [unclassified Actinobaculum]|uniref:TetR/AcrR family transcriptional regulator n=1 Tax=unclassified Actinobaculum TaxID=2609299 RepID=UPI0013DDA832|nr:MULTISPECIES: TetR family transcriptional regulator [unclassified Actinobaculum]
MADYLRARSAEQKSERMQAIMDAADGLFNQRPYHQITMGSIAAELGWSRSNLYKYAATQEEIFLALHSQKNRDWLAHLEQELSAAPLATEQFARIWAHVTEEHAGFLRYQEILTSIIESNVTPERLTDFKGGFAEMTVPITEILSRQCGISAQAALELYLRLLYQAPGLYNHFHSSPMTRAAISAAGLPAVRGNFADSYTEFVLMCLENAASAG